MLEDDKLHEKCIVLERNFGNEQKKSVGVDNSAT